MTADSSLQDAVASLVLLVGGVAITAVYFIPGIIAGCRNHRNTGAIVMLNFLAGWTFIGWVVAMVWACTEDRK